MVTNYTSFYQNTITINEVGKKKGSGVAIYVHSSLNAIHDATRSDVSPDIETLFLSITNTPKPVTVEVVYRPPNGNMLLFLDQYRQIINSLQDKTSYIMGDFNINLLSNSSPINFCEYEQNLLNSNFSPLISTITHEIPGCKTSCIDNIHTNDHDNVLISGTLQNRLSHHYPIFHFSNIVCSDDAAKTILKQNYNFSKSNLENFVDVFSEKVHNFSIVDNDFQTFQKIFTDVMDETC